MTLSLMLCACRSSITRLPGLCSSGTSLATKSPWNRYGSVFYFSKKSGNLESPAAESSASASDGPAVSKASHDAVAELATARVFGQEWTQSTRGMRPSTNARAWKASELRLKSTDDLHRLWFVMMKEKLALLSERDFCRRNQLLWKGSSDLWKLRKGMARLKTVVGERIRQKQAEQRERKWTE
ncbi:hypothetical protein, conserved [Cyanidioschyzon merolae strain 10D]|uniref:Large ribosomal subunit protein uL29m n=1 Tax=Cyanidioschyzon merolae (strain NIES-3377 / 10D) TaxID=280699 RepID=M1VHF1_CYAM1|nr:hypothetical protein, conserved [Cyanidioschyzon merolae strain 10D]BAM82767.1 hypothetical protein, conserved [Cyanidioschyzon merolae strain 10D]|eukprot:XP_005538803.1 hypothetical protein, conserved [Cyanidioschyzon merolae strain 10D]